MASNILKELERIVDPYAKRRPSIGDNQECIYGCFGERSDRKEGIFGDLDFNVEEGREEKKSNNQGDISIGNIPPNHCSLIPSEVEQDQSRNSRYRTCEVKRGLQVK